MKNAYGQDIRQLEENHAYSVKTLKEAGFKLETSYVAGIDSGSTWVHPDGDTAEVTLRNGNLAKYSDLKAVWVREHGLEMAEKLMKISEEISKA